MSTPAEALPTWLVKLLVEQAAFASNLGKFVLAWSDVEAMAKRVLIKYAGVSEAIGHAVFQDRVKPNTDAIKAICSNTNVSKARRENLDHIIAQITTINTIRDRIVHFGSNAGGTFHPENMKSGLTNVGRARRQSQEFAYYVGSDDLRLLIKDCDLICSSLGKHLLRGRFQPWFVDGALPPWRYKSLQPVVRQEQCRGRRPTSSSRRRSSLEKVQQRK